MKKRLNSVFFGVCFLAALSAQAYTFIYAKGDLINSVGFGIVTLITGYLLFSEIRNDILQEQIGYYADRMMLQELIEWKAEFHELTNIQKASYTATKKNTEVLLQELKQITSRLETLENSNSSALYLVAELQRRGLDGQKKALNLEVHYGKENTKELLTALQTLEHKIDVDGKFNQILTLLEDGSISRTEAADVLNAEEKKDKKVTPIYEDPNKALSAQEIASLFESFGQ